MRIAILTFHRAYNCGAMLQAWALKTVLERMGHEVSFPVCNHVGETERWRFDQARDYRGFAGIRHFVIDVVSNVLSIGAEDVNRRSHQIFRQHNLPEVQCSVAEFVDRYDLVIVGSDQVWNPAISLVDTPIFWGESVPSSLPIVAYAASIGDRYSDEDIAMRLAKAAERFRTVSVREPYLKQALEKHGVEASVTLDPVLLVDRQDFTSIADDTITPDEPYVFLYAVNASKFVLNAAREIANGMRVRLVISSPYQYSRFHAPKEILWGVSADRMVSLAMHAKCCLGASFHGTVLPLALGVPFLSLCETTMPSISRQESILEALGQGSRIIRPGDSLEIAKRLCMEQFDVQTCPELRQMRQDSLQYLEDCCRV